MGVNTGDNHPVPTSKKQKKASTEGQWEEEEVWEDYVPKKARKYMELVQEVRAGANKLAAFKTNPEDLEPGTAVLYFDSEKRGTIHDAFIPLDEFWVKDEAGEIVRDAAGEIVQFKSSDLELVAPTPVKVPVELGDDDMKRGGAIIFGTEEQMMKILQHFGTPETTQRQNPQQLLAIPCNMCEPDRLQALACEGVEESIVELAQKQREDIYVAIRAFQLKHAVQHLNPDLVYLEGYYCLAAVQIPFNWTAIEDASASKRVRKMRKDVFNQIDLCPTAVGEYVDEAYTQAAARRSLGETCGIEVSDLLWSQEAQMALRKELKVEMEYSYEDPNGVHVVAIILPKNAVSSTIKGLLCFSEAPEKGAEAASSSKQASASGASARGGKTVNQWEQDQSEFANEPKLPPGWIRIKSNSTGKVYYYNKKTQQSTFDIPEQPLPEGWTKQVSKSTGKSYYFHAGRKQSQFTRPTE
mmetsp:Transcript_37451/g.105757  ORF Transcript_37451/g.105757 Transcript_37451/m.105757 type:complete len:468 (-) Transcript_37451:58-1461(-)